MHTALSNSSPLTVKSLRVRAVNVPLGRPVKTSSGAILTAPLVLVDLQTAEGVVGSSYVFCYMPAALKPVATLVANIGEMLVGEDVAPVAIANKLERRFRLLGPQGLVGVALAAVDMAAWDATCRAAGLPLVRFLGGAPRPLAVYNSFGMTDVAGVGALADESVAAGFHAMKIKIGYPEVADDVAAIRRVRQVAGETMALMADYNQSLSVPEAIRRVRIIDDENIAWIEEPVRADDYAGHATVAQAARTPIQIGENWWGPADMAKSIAAGASDLAMPDVMKIGGVTGWLRAAALAQAAGLPMSSHIFPEISAHLLAISPTCHWLEYLDFAGPILVEPMRVINGCVSPSSAPGCGIAWNEKAVERYLA
jgi:mandelate racemase